MISNSSFWLAIIVSVPIFWLLPKKYRMVFLAATSFAFLASVELLSTLFLVVWVAAFYVFAPITASKGVFSRVVPLLVLSILSYLSLFKYVPRLFYQMTDDPFFQKIALPLGISYFTFKLIHYAVEVGRKNVPDHKFQDFVCYIFLFPIFSAGPIQRFDRFLNDQSTEFDTAHISVGLTRIMHGLIKKFILGGILLVAAYGDINSVTLLLEHFDTLTPLQVWKFYIISYLLLYMDFSAYSDIAIGVSRLFGFRIMENFNWPILSKNIGEFWSRWHMTLAGWCQTYIYMPLIGRTRNPYLASYGSFVTMGLWHAGSLGWIGWGLYHATGVVSYVAWIRLRRRKKWKGLDRNGLRWVGWSLTLLFVSAGGAFTSMHDTGTGYDILRILAKLLFFENM